MDLVGELGKRLASMRRMVVYVAAKDLLDGLVSMIPKEEQYAPIRDNLKISEIALGKKGAAFAVHANIRAKKVRKIDTAKTVIYVRAKKQLSRPDDDIKLLEDMGPWTPDTIPFWPGKKRAIVIQRQVSKREADKVAKLQEKQKQKVRAELDRLGHRSIDKRKQKLGKPRRSGKAIPDIAMTAVTLEFGGAGQRAVPAWRTTLSDIMSSGIKTAPRRFRELADAISNPDSKEWRTWPRISAKIKAGKANEFVGFQKRLGYG
jgi:hypothetical protein